jgi:hypothetical protein
MKPRVGAPLVRISPSPEGWRAQTGADACAGATLVELVSKVPSNLRAELLLPSSAIVTERLTLPKAPREDLFSMAQLQLEKLLPYTADDFVFDIEELGGVGEESQILAIAVPFSELKACAEPLRSSKMGPVAVGVYAVQLAREVESGGRVLVVWREGGNVFLLIAVNGKLHWVEELASENSAPAVGEVQRVLLGAELSGALPEEIDRVYVCAGEWFDAVHEALPRVAADEVALVPSGALVGNWLPAPWAEEAAALSRKSRMIERLQWAAIGYAALLAAGFCWLAFEKSRISKLDRQIGELQPRVEVAKARQNRWRNLEPALEPSRYLIELLHQSARAVGGVDIRITEFQMNPKEFAFSAEASNVAEAIEYVGRLKKEGSLASFKIDSPNPNILPNERAQFRVTGKVEMNAAKK